MHASDRSDGGLAERRLEGRCLGGAHRFPVEQVAGDVGGEERQALVAAAACCRSSPGERRALQLAAPRRRTKATLPRVTKRRRRCTAWRLPCFSLPAAADVSSAQARRSQASPSKSQPTLHHIFYVAARMARNAKPLLNTVGSRPKKASRYVLTTQRRQAVTFDDSGV